MSGLAIFSQIINTILLLTDANTPELPECKVLGFLYEVAVCIVQGVYVYVTIQCVVYQLVTPCAFLCVLAALLTFDTATLLEGPL